jgi:hypothetical protein
MLLSIGPPEGRSDDDVPKAAKAYRQAQQAELSEEFALASDLYELADQLAPSPEALRGAVRMALAAERWAVAAENAVALERRYPDDKKSAELAEQTLARTRPLLNEVAIDCGGVECTVLVDGKSARLEPHAKHVVFVTAGEHRLAGGYPSGTSQEVTIAAQAGGTSNIVFAPPVVTRSDTPAPANAASTSESDTAPRVDRDEPRPRKSRQRLSPWFFGVGTVATLGLAAGTTVSALQAQKAGKEFDDGGRTRPLYDKANSLEIQTNVLFGVTAAVGITTIVFAIFTDWQRGKKKDKRRATARLAPGPAWAGSGFAVDF